MKTKTLFAACSLMLAAAFFSGCKKEQTCAAWHEGPDCVRMTAKFAGAWYGTGECTGLSSSVEHYTITESPQENRLLLTQDNVSFYGELYDTGRSFNIPVQSIPYGGTIDGLGFINDAGALYIEFTVHQAGYPDFVCSATLSK